MVSPDSHHRDVSREVLNVRLVLSFKVCERCTGDLQTRTRRQKASVWGLACVRGRPRRAAQQRGPGSAALAPRSGEARGPRTLWPLWNVAAPLRACAQDLSHVPGLAQIHVPLTSSAVSPWAWLTRTWCVLECGNSAALPENIRCFSLSSLAKSHW